MAGVRAGGDRQELHEALRVHSQAAGEQVKQHGRENDLIERLQGDPLFASVDLAGTLDAGQFTGRASEQIDEFLAGVVDPIRDRYAGSLDADGGEVTV